MSHPRKMSGNGTNSRNPVHSAMLRLQRKVNVSANRTYVRLVETSMRNYGYCHEADRFVGAFRARRSDLILAISAELESRAIEIEKATGRYPFSTVQLSQLIKKFPFHDLGFTGLDPEGTARLAFAKAEHRCGRFNTILRLRKTERSVSHNAVFNSMREYIHDLLGSSPILSKVYDNCGFGPGASLGVSGNATSLIRKVIAENGVSCTPTALPYFAASIKRDPLWREILLGPQLVLTDLTAVRDAVESIAVKTEYNTVSYVPKTAKTFRSIAVEPLGNSWLQKGTDIVLRELLHQKWGIDLRDQSRNQRMAQEGSYRFQEDPYCTIDLSSASDSISIELCRWLLPPDWFAFLCRIRSPAYKEGDKIVPYRKFVSMGNGFCFPLQTILFAAACRASGAALGDFTVYGDDIIVRRSVFPTVVKLLGEMGFRINRDKTFSEGLFRESCGADFYDGVDVRPVVLDKQLDSLESLFALCNVSNRRKLSENFFREFRDWVIQFLGTESPFVRPYSGPDDTCLEVPQDVALSSPWTRVNRDLGCLEWWELAHDPVKDHYGEEHKDVYASALMMAALKGSPSSKPFVIRRKTRTSVRRSAYAGAQSTWVPVGYLTPLELGLVRYTHKGGRIA